MRIALMIIRLIIIFPFFLFNMSRIGKKKEWDREKCYNYVSSCAKKANKRGRVTIESHGVENIPKEDGFVLFPNHQGMYDVLAFLESCPRPFSFVAKMELKNVPLLKQTMACLHAIPIDRKDLRQSMKVIQEMTERVKQGENFIIFAEGTRSRMGNKMNEMKGGSFKSAVKAQAPIVPCALIDSFIPFDEQSIRKVKVKLFYLEPMYYEEYKDMSTVEIAEEVKRRIEAVIAENS